MSGVMTSRIGRFEILDSLGDGVAGNHYRAFDPATNRNVAVETFRLGTLPSDAARDAFVQGLKRSAHLLHSRIASVFDVGIDNDLAYVAGEDLDGKTLDRSMLEYGPFELREIAAIVRQVGAALDHAHEQGVVHGGLEPARILVLENGDVKVTGFGTDFPAVRTAQGAHTFAGEPKYFSPERVRGEALTHRADIFSLGAIVYELLTGHAPFDSDSLITSLYRAVNEPHELATTLRPELPGGIDEVLGYALAKQPKDRYLSCATFVDSLEALIPAEIPAPNVEKESLMADTATQFCDQCGSELQAKMKFCWSCGSTVALPEVTPIEEVEPAAPSPVAPAPIPVPVPIESPAPVAIDRSAETAPVVLPETADGGRVTTPAKAPAVPAAPVAARSASTSKGSAVRPRATTAMDAIVGGLDGPTEPFPVPLRTEVAPARTAVSETAAKLPPPLSGYALSTGTKDLPAPGAAIDAAPAKPSAIRAMAPILIYLLILLVFAVLGFLSAPRFLVPRASTPPAEQSAPAEPAPVAPESAPGAPEAVPPAP